MLRPYERFTVVPALPPRVAPLRELAYNLWWSWNLDAVDLFRRLDRDHWETAGHNPVLMLGTIKQERLEEAANDDGFLSHMMRVYQTLNRYLSNKDTWYRKNLDPDEPDQTIAYFSAEYGITESLPIYSGGMGVLAGDTLKSASDLGLPLVAVGLLYQEGYFRQYLNADGWQQESYPINDFHTMPVLLERGADGKPLIVELQLPGRMVTVQIWCVRVGRVSLYLLDANLDANRPEDRAITGRLYGGDVDMRIRQEILLGIGGMRALVALGIASPARKGSLICHMNEGHSAFLALERIRMAMVEKSVPFAVAKEMTTAGNIFTTHTAVPAGIDLFPPYLMDHYFTSYREQLGLGREDFLRLGQSTPNQPEQNFSMAVLALRLAAKTNAVSRLHGQVARSMWRELWPGTPVEDVPICSITNGIHPRSWISSDMTGLLVRYLGPRWIERPYDQSVWRQVDRIPDEELWHTHERRRERLVAVARARLRQQLERRGATPKEIEDSTEVLNPDALTIVFARRFATYKRALLLFRDVERLSRILNQSGGLVQIIFSGKAHPRDNPGKEFIRDLIHYVRRDDLRRRVIFLEDYDMSLARYLLQGADVWLNTPRRGMEASGTSGMKAAMNGAINLSTLDGWWVEGYSPEVGWSIGSGETYEDDNYGDAVEAETLYDLLEKSVIPLFYERSHDGLPRNWIAKMKSSMREIGPMFNTHRMVEEYARNLYIPEAQRYLALNTDQQQGAKDLATWLERVRQHWAEVRITAAHSDVQDSLPVGTQVNIKALVSLGELQPEDVLVQVYYGLVSAQGDIIDYSIAEMTTEGRDPNGQHIYSVPISSNRSGLHGYSLRILPKHTLLDNPHIPGLVVWSS
jgi:starch phosphorylase